MGLTAPKGRVETLAGNSGQFVFPSGNYEAVLEQVHINEIPTDEEGVPFSGYANPEGTVLSLQFSMDPIEISDDEVEIGDRKYFVKIVLNDGELTIDEVDIDERDVPHWRLQQSARTLLNFFMATGHAEEDDEGNVVVPDETIDLLERGDIDGQKVGLTIVHRKESSNRFKARLEDDDKATRRVYDNLGGFFPA